MLTLLNKTEKASSLKVRAWSFWTKTLLLNIFQPWLHLQVLPPINSMKFSVFNNFTSSTDLAEKTSLNQDPNLTRVDLVNNPDLVKFSLLTELLWSYFWPFVNEKFQTTYIREQRLKKVCLLFISHLLWSKKISCN